MKILFVTDLYPIGEEKIARTLYYFVRKWQSQGHQIDVVRSNFIFNTFIRGRKIIKEKVYFENGIKIYNLNFHTPFLFNVYNKLPVDFSLKNYDVIISHMPCGALMAQKLLEKDNIKYICAVHASDIRVLSDIKYSFYFKKQLKKSYLLADKISARSPVLKEKINKLIPQTSGKTFICPSGIPKSFIVNTKQTYLNRDKLKLITVASLIQRKNIDTLIKTVNDIQNMTLTVIGSGKEENKLKKLAQSNIIFKGQIKREKVFEELKMSDIFVLLSDEETFGLSYLEAMASGCIVIGKKGDGLDGIILNEVNGFLVENSVQDLKKCLENIKNMSDAEIEVIRANSLKTAAEYTEDNMAENYIENIK